MAQTDETHYIPTVSMRCNLIQRHNIWYNNTNIWMRFCALFYFYNFYNYLIYKQFDAN